MIARSTTEKLLWACFGSLLDFCMVLFFALPKGYCFLKFQLNSLKNNNNKNRRKQEVEKKLFWRYLNSAFIKLLKTSCMVSLHLDF